MSSNDKASETSTGAINPIVLTANTVTPTATNASTATTVGEGLHYPTAGEPANDSNTDQAAKRGPGCPRKQRGEGEHSGKGVGEHSDMAECMESMTQYFSQMFQQQSQQSQMQMQLLREQSQQQTELFREQLQQQREQYQQQMEEQRHVQKEQAEILRGTSEGEGS